MSDISLLGLGPMGAALGRALIAGGHRITVWNRTAAKAAPLVDLGAQGAVSVAVAVAASPVTLVCLDSYQTTRALMQIPEVMRLLAGRIVVDLTTATPAEARAAEPWFSARGARYLDGAILCGVRAIGTAQGLLLYSGDEAAFHDSRRVLRALGAEPRFVGAEVGAAAVLDMAWLTRIAVDYIGLYQGAAVCRAEGVAIDHFAAVFPADDAAQVYLAPLLTNDFGQATANVAVWNKAARRMAAQARDAGVSPALPDLVVDILSRTEAAGFGHQRMAAMVKVLGRAGDFADDR